MKDFKELNNSLNLEEFLDSSRGALYITPEGYVPELLVRKFDGELSTDLIKPFAEIVNAVSHWIAEHSEIAKYLQVEPVIETGVDFIIFKYHEYQTSLAAYFEWETPPEIPGELEKMQNIFMSSIKKINNEKDPIIEDVLKRSIMEASNKTYFNETIKKFIIVEPRITHDHCLRWLDQVSQ